MAWDTLGHGTHLLKSMALLESRVTQKVTLCLLLPVASIWNIRHSVAVPPPYFNASLDSLGIAPKAVPSGEGTDHPDTEESGSRPAHTVTPPGTQ